MGSTMRATAGGKEFTGRSWNEVVAKIAVAYRLDTSAGQRVDAARTLIDGYTAILVGIRITPKK